MSAGKRLSTDEPLTEHDVAERLTSALLRVTRILEDIVADPSLHQAVQGSRYLPGGVVAMTQDALDRFRQGKHWYCAPCRNGAFIDDGHRQVDP